MTTIQLHPGMWREREHVLVEHGDHPLFLFGREIQCRPAQLLLHRRALAAPLAPRARLAAEGARVDKNGHAGVLAISRLF